MPRKRRGQLFLEYHRGPGWTQRAVSKPPKVARPFSGFRRPDITGERSPEANTDRFDYVFRDRSNARGGEHESIFHVPDDTPSTELRQQYLVYDRDTKSSPPLDVLCGSLKI
jgi:hypothetical protein